jgi:hypothetical protein
MQGIYLSLIATVAQPQTAHLELILRLNLTTQLHQTILAHLLAEKYLLDADSAVTAIYY